MRHDRHYGPATAPMQIADLDLFVLENGKVCSVNVFVDGIE